MYLDTCWTEVKEIIKGRRDRATNTTTNGDRHQAGDMLAKGHKQQRFLS